MKATIWNHNGEKKQPRLLHYKECGLDDVYLMGGYTIHETPYGEGISIKNLDELHRAIGCYLVREKKLLSGKELRFLRKHMNLTQSELGKLLGLSSQQVARWEKEQSEISTPADRLLRGLFVQHACEELDLQKLVEMLEELDSAVSEKAIFSESAEGWIKKAA